MSAHQTTAVHGEEPAGMYLEPRDRPGCISVATMRHYFEGAVTQTVKLHSRLPLTRRAVAGDAGAYCSHEVQGMWAGFALGMRCAERVAEATGSSVQALHADQRYVQGLRDGSKPFTCDGCGKTIAQHGPLLQCESTAPAVAEQEPDEQSVFESWLERRRPSGDADQVHRQWLESGDYADFLDGWNAWNSAAQSVQKAAAAQEPAALAEVTEADPSGLEAKVRWLLNPCPVGTVLYEAAPQDVSKAPAGDAADVIAAVNHAISEAVAGAEDRRGKPSFFGVRPEWDDGYIQGIKVCGMVVQAAMFRPAAAPSAAATVQQAPEGAA